MDYFNSRIEDMQQEPNTWRELLGTIIADAHTRQRLAEELGVRQITLTRWANGESDPRPQNLRRLISAFPQYRELLIELIPEEFADFSAAAEDDASKEIPASFYTRVFNARAITGENMRFWSISSLILQQAIGQLDPDRIGMAMMIAQCMPPPKGQKVRSLRESAGYGTYPWSGDLSQKGLFLGAESLAGYVVTTCHSAVIANTEKETMFPAHRVEYEKSCAIYPILYTGRIAGCLIASSAETNHFISSTRLSLLQKYTDLLALAIEPENFYEPEEIQLRVMPNQQTQREHFADFRQRVASTMIEAARRNKPLNNLEAEDFVWRELEAELLQRTVEAEAVATGR